MRFDSVNAAPQADFLVVLGPVEKVFGAVLRGSGPGRSDGHCGVSRIVQSACSRTGRGRVCAVPSIETARQSPPLSRYRDGTRGIAAIENRV